MVLLETLHDFISAEFLHREDVGVLKVWFVDESVLWRILLVWNSRLRLVKPPQMTWLGDEIRPVRGKRRLRAQKRREEWGGTSHQELHLGTRTRQSCFFFPPVFWFRYYVPSGVIAGVGRFILSFWSLEGIKVECLGVTCFLTARIGTGSASDCGCDSEGMVGLWCLAT